MRKYFGTDGMRGLVNSGSMTPESIMRLAMAAGHYFKSRVGRHLVIIGKDTRLSGYMVETSMVAGFTAVGMDVLMVGPVSTPAIAILTKSMRADAGIVISASHNPFYDNGIKLFGPDGYKLSDAVELEIERLMDRDSKHLYAAADKIGRAMRLDDVAQRYTNHLKSILPDTKQLKGIKIALDTANGAAYKIAADVLTDLGANVNQIGNTPNGKNINDGVGATAPQQLQEFVRQTRSDIGIALDGDADRLIVVDELSNIIDGDQIMALVATYLKDVDMLKGNVVATVMSNMGLEEYLQSQGIGLTRTKVGDRYVVEEMRASGANFGGEQSGHLVMSEFTSTGDGLLAGLLVIASIQKSGKTASQMCNVFEPYPQILKNIKVKDFSVLNNPEVCESIKQGDEMLKGKGRTLIRKSGTEPLIRVMAEGRDIATVQQVVDSIIDTIKKVS